MLIPHVKPGHFSSSKVYKKFTFQNILFYFFEIFCLLRMCFYDTFLGGKVYFEFTSLPQYLLVPDLWWIISKFEPCWIFRKLNSALQNTVLLLISTCEDEDLDLEQVLSFPRVVSDWKTDYFWQSYGHLPKKCLNFHKNRHISVKNDPIFNPKPPLESSKQGLSSH